MIVNKVPGNSKLLIIQNADWSQINAIKKEVQLRASLTPKTCTHCNIISVMLRKKEATEEIDVAGKD